MSTPTPKVSFVNPGCPKALVGFERTLTQLHMEGYKVVPTYEDTNVVVVNIYGFIDSAGARSLEMIGKAIAENGKIVITDCMGMEEHVIHDVHPSVLTVTGPQQYKQVVTAVHEVAPSKTGHNPLVDLIPPQDVKLIPRHYAYLKTSEGCNHSCNFCIIPSMHGRLVSRPVGDALSEAEHLVKAKVKELLVISWNTSAYGVNPKYKTDFWNSQPVKTRMKELCEALSSMGVRVRLHYAYPYPNVDDVIPLMVAGKLLSYLDIPFQHASPKALKVMEHPAFEDRTLARIKQRHKTCPELVIRSTFIVGSPGEVEEDFQYLLDWLVEAQLDRVGYFQYSPVKGAPANELGLEPVPDEVKQDRWGRFMAHQQTISAAHLQFEVGKKTEVLIDEIDEQGAVNRPWVDAPEINDNMLVDSDELKSGDKVRVHITDIDEYDLWIKLV